MTADDEPPHFLIQAFLDARSKRKNEPCNASDILDARRDAQTAWNAIAPYLEPVETST